ncbi:MAG TPA: type II toxin-antitoxin system HipA family toxin YjjJ [Rhizobacter sp.]|nr:type II toxin-antitoxin system HipA family toxin YjjJ [Rhizobacter sp.]
MRPRNQGARDQLTAVLARHAAVSAADLARQLDVSIPTLHRLLQEIEDRVLVTGKARRTRYALRRPMRGDAADLPVYEVDQTGHAEQVSRLALVRPAGTLMRLQGTVWPVPDESRDGWWPGLPYPLCDMRPQGYMGRQFARAEHRQLAVSANPQEWSEEDCVFVLSRSGSDVTGNLILGNPACERWLNGKVAQVDPLKSAGLGKAYAALAEHAVAAGMAGSSAAGEFPKFTALRELRGSATPHVIVKFSGADGSSAVQRWADLLVCEHLALECAATLPEVQSARSRILGHAGRTFLEVERFDRHGPLGRSPLVSLETINAALIGDASMDWTRLAGRLVSAGLLSVEDALRVDHLWWFGRLVANTDMHAGNLSFRPHGTLTLAPTYDMVPMLYAPLPGGETPARAFDPALPLPPQRSVWTAACTAAVCFWQQVSKDARISDAFRHTAGANAKRLQALAARV